jgi:hypothetical protein
MILLTRSDSALVELLISTPSDFVFKLNYAGVFDGNESTPAYPSALHFIY